MSAKPISIQAPANPNGLMKHCRYGELVGVNGAKIPAAGGLFMATDPLPDGVLATRVDPWEYITKNQIYRGETEIVGAQRFRLDYPTIIGWETFGLRFLNCNNGWIREPKGQGPGNILQGERGYAIILENCSNVTIDAPSIPDSHIMIMMTGSCRDIVIRNADGSKCHKVAALHGGTFDKVYIASCTGFLECGSPQWPTKASKVQVLNHTGPIEINGDVRGTVGFLSTQSALDYRDHGKVFERAIRGQAMTEYWFPCVDLFGPTFKAGLVFEPKR